MTELTKRIRHLVSLDRPENGGPYGGIAAQECMKALTEAADRLDQLEAAVSRAMGTLTFPVASEIDARGYSLHTPNQDRWEFLVETLALPSPPHRYKGRDE